jgi:hypothetical protein
MDVIMNLCLISRFMPTMRDGVPLPPLQRHWLFGSIEHRTSFFSLLTRKYKKLLFMQKQLWGCTFNQ